MLHFFIIMLNIPQCISDNADVVAQNHLKIVQAGDSVNFTCILPNNLRSSVVWVRQRVGEKPLLIASSYQALAVKFENEFDKNKRFFVANYESGFNLSITNTEESDTGTYYCIIYAFMFIFGDGTDLIVKGGQLSIDSEHQRPETDPDPPEESSASLQCAVVTQSCAGQHNVYWFRHESGESPPGIIYTQERRNAQCERTSDGNSTTHTCVYNLPKNISHYDAGIYYCAVATCGEILFGEGRKVDLPDKCFQTHWTTAALIIIIVSVIMIIIMAARLYKHQQKDRMHYSQHGQLMADDADTLNYAALSFQQNPSASRRPMRERISQDNSIYTHVR